MNKKTIVYCDDQQRFIDLFIKRHSEYYNIIPVSDSRELPEMIARLKNLPDIILLDLYHPRDEDPLFEQKRQRAETALNDLDGHIKLVNEAVLDAWEPRGLEILKMLREQYRNDQLPIAIYTQKGLILLDDEQLRGVEQNDGHWLLKGTLSARTEELRIDRIINSSKKLSHETVARASQRYRISLAVSWLIIGFLLARTFLNTNQLADLAIAVVAGIITAAITVPITRAIESAR